MKTTLLIASYNSDKLREIKAILQNIPVALKSLFDVGITDIIKETGQNYHQNAQIKAEYAGRKTGLLTLAEDSGLEIDELSGKPGIYSARFAGEGCSYLDNNKKLLKLLKGVEDKNRKARFITVIAISDGGKKPVLVKGVCSGKISAELKGAKGFGYDPVFIPSDHNKSYAEMSLALKNKISHRGKALDKAKWLLLRLIKRQKDL